MLGTYEEGKTMGAAYTRIPCLRVPISSFDEISSPLSSSTGTIQADRGTFPSPPSEYFHPEARQATAVFLVPQYVALLSEDELRHGRRTDITGTVQPYRYTVSGIQDYDTFAYQNIRLVFCMRMQ
jgi:hypothetical protein